MQSVFLGHMDEPITFIYKGKNAVQVTKHSAYVDVKVENLCQSGVTAHDFTPNSPIAGLLTIEKTTTCENITLGDLQAEIRTFLQAVGFANMNMQSGELTTPWYEALAAYMPTPNPLPVLTKAIIDNLEDDQSVCVAIKVGNKYLPSYIVKVGTTSLAWYSNGCDVDPESGLFTGVSVTETPIAQAEVVENIIGISCDHDDNVQADFATVAGEAIVALGYEIDETARDEVPSAMQYRFGY